MHREVKSFIRSIRKELPHKFRFRSVLEVGSKIINGSPRNYFFFCKYCGVDISAGKGVDIVGAIHKQPHLYTMTDFDVCISTECLEHDMYYKETLVDMYGRLKDGGLMIITCASIHRMEHGTTRLNPECSPDTTDYYHNISVEEFMQILPQELFETYVLMNARGKNDLYFYGIKPYKKWAT